MCLGLHPAPTMENEEGETEIDIEQPERIQLFHFFYSLKLLHCFDINNQNT